MAFVLTVSWQCWHCLTRPFVALLGALPAVHFRASLRVAVHLTPCFACCSPQILSSQYVDCSALLRVLPSARLLELKAVLLERLGRCGRMFVVGRIG